MSSGRRNFIKKTVLASLASAAFPTILSAGYPANEKLVVGLTGADSQGFKNLKYFLNQLNIECGAIYDSDKNMLEKIAAETEKIQGKKPLIYNDFRRLAENNDVDLVINSIPGDVGPLISACESGKDIYTTAPLVISEQDFCTITALQKSNGNIIETDRWSYRHPVLQKIIRHMRSEKFGIIKNVHVWNYTNYQNTGTNSFNKLNTNQSADLFTRQSMQELHKAISLIPGKEPHSLFSTGANYQSSLKTEETPDTVMSIFDFGEFELLWDRSAFIHFSRYRRNKGVAFKSTKGILLIDDDNWQWNSYSDKSRQDVICEIQNFDKNGNHLHVMGFIDNVKTRQSSDISLKTAALISKANNLAQLACLRKKKLLWGRCLLDR